MLSSEDPALLSLANRKTDPSIQFLHCFQFIRKHNCWLPFKAIVLELLLHILIYSFHGRASTLFTIGIKFQYNFPSILTCFCLFLLISITVASSKAVVSSNTFGKQRKTFSRAVNVDEMNGDIQKYVFKMLIVSI